jgi:hypothetical protein
MLVSPIEWLTRLFPHIFRLKRKDSWCALTQHFVYAMYRFSRETGVSQNSLRRIILSCTEY